MAENQEIETKVKQAISEMTGVGVERCTDDAILMDDLGADSLDVIVMALEDEFNVEIPDGSYTDASTVRDMVEHVCQRLGQTPPPSNHVNSASDLRDMIFQRCVVLVGSYGSKGADSFVGDYSRWSPARNFLYEKLIGDPDSKAARKAMKTLRLDEAKKLSDVNFLLFYETIARCYARQM